MDESFIRNAIERAEPFRDPTDARIVPFARKSETLKDIDHSCAKLMRNDLGNGERFVARKRAEFIHVRDIGWHSWTGTHWSRQEGTTGAQIAAQEVAVRIKAELWAAQGMRRQEEDDVAFTARTGFEASAHKAWIADLRAWAVHSGYSSHLAAMLREAAPHLTVDIEAMDQDGYLLNVYNGTLRITDDEATVSLHDPSQRITKCAPVQYDPRATAPHWQAFLNLVQPDPTVQAFLQRAVGYSLTADVSEQVVFMNGGGGQNGKSTFFETIRMILGGYATSLPFASLIENDKKGGGEATPDLADLPGARFVVASEAKANVRIDEALIKQMTGGEPMKVRRLRRDFVEFRPHFKLWLSFNHRPTIRGQDKGIWRRIQFVPWNISIPEASIDRNFLREKLMPELPGILNWALAGAAQWRQIGLRPPQPVLDATAEYRSESDPLGAFLGSRVVRKDGAASVPAKAIYEAYKSWAQDNAVDPVTQTSFGRIMAELGFKRIKAGTISYLGIVLLELPNGPNADEPDSEAPAYEPLPEVYEH